MSDIPLIRSTPWDTLAFDMPTWELLEYSALALEWAKITNGHHTIKVNPLADKKLLHEYGFYYCDTVIEPNCSKDRLRLSRNPKATISKIVDANHVTAICHGAFAHGRFHRDYNLSKSKADLRYDNWLKELLNKEQVYGLYWERELAGFIGYSENNLVLHAIAENYRGKGLAKYWWSEACIQLLKSNNQEVKSSISVSNLPILRLYASLGFSFNNPKDIYHCVVD